VHFFKLDVEGAEPLALAGAALFIAVHKPTAIAMEIGLQVRATRWPCAAPRSGARADVGGLGRGGRRQAAPSRTHSGS
jgi:hypothetical protein